MNETTVTTVKAAIAAAVATMTALWGWFGWLVIAWVLLMLADWLIGNAAAARGALVQRQDAGGRLAQGRDDPSGVYCLVADWLIGEHPGAYPGGVLPFDYSVCWRRW